MGKVSVQGENPSVPLDQQQPSSFNGGNNPLGGLGELGGLGGLKGLGESSFAGLGGGLAGLGSLDGSSAASQPLASVPGMGGKAEFCHDFGVKKLRRVLHITLK